jgi:peptide/nickel transport system permease protein
MIVVAITAPWIAPYQINQIDLANSLQPPGGEHLLGSDNLGRDVFSQLVYGVRPYVTAGLIATGMALVVGLITGLVAARAGGRPDRVLRWAILVPLVLPALGLLLIASRYLSAFIPIPISTGALVMIMDKSPLMQYVYLPLLISLIFLPAVHRAFRRIFGRSTFTEECRPADLVTLSLVTFGVAIGFALLFVAWAGYHGLGIPPGIPEWGGALSGEGRSYIESSPWIIRYYLIAIGVALVGAIFFGEATFKIWFPRLAGAADRA